MPAPVTPLTEADLIEVFSSVQGEGVLVGYRQIFLRLPECNLNCDYCDTPFAATSHCTLEDPPGSGELLQLENPVHLETLLDILQRWILEAPGAHHSFSITGGEPLLHAERLQVWLPELRSLLPTYLETNGTLPDQLKMVLPHLDWVSMDLKLESLTGEKTDWDAHRQFLRLANQTNCYVKMVVAETTPALELQMGAELVAEVCPTIPLVLQPVTVDDRVAVSTKTLLEMQRLLAGTHGNIRIIPQTHRYLGVM